MKRLFGWLVNFFPEHVFYADDFMRELIFKCGETDNPHETDGSTACLGVAVAASRVVAPGGKFVAEYTAVTDKGRDIGDYKITIERLR